MSCVICLLSLVIGASQMRGAYASAYPSKANLTEEWLADLAEYRRILNDWRNLVEEECDLSDSEDVWQSLFEYHNSNHSSSMNDQYDIRQRYRQERETYRKLMEFYKHFLKYCKSRICPDSTIASENIATTEAVSTQSDKYTTEGSEGLTTTSHDNEEDMTDGYSATKTTRPIATTAQIDVSTRSENENPWIVFQRRQDGSVNFNRNLDDYVNGFGDPEGEYWRGLDEIHNLTKDGDHELRIDMIDTDGNHWYAEYSNFSVGSSQTNYILTIGGYSGNATDGLSFSHNQQEFTTSDADNDKKSSGNCAITYRGGWWYNDCAQSLLNGVYLAYVVWDHSERGYTRNRFTEMKTRKSTS